jgi:SMODS domain-containing protein
MSVSTAFDEFRQALEIDKDTIEKAIELHEKAREGLRDRLEGHKRSILSGSYPRTTRLEPLDDIDIIAIVENTVPWDNDPEIAMEAAGEAVRPAFPGCTIQLGAHAAKVKPKDPPIPNVHLDIVIATETGDGSILEISERKPESNWKKSDPEAHASKLSDANDAWQKRLKPAIKQVKHWNRNTDGDSLRSFLVEALGLRIFTGDGDLSAAKMIQRFFNEAKSAVLTPTMSPAVPDGYVDGDMTDAERQEHADRLSKASDKADEAIAAEDAGDASAAQEIWYALFGDPFPEPEKDDRKAKIADALRAGIAGVGGGTIIKGGGRPVVPGRSFGVEQD